MQRCDHPLPGLMESGAAELADIPPPQSATLGLHTKFSTFYKLQQSPMGKFYIPRNSNDFFYIYNRRFTTLLE